MVHQVEWTSATAINGWTNYGGSWQPLEYRKIGDKVQIRGMLQGNSRSSTTLYNISADYRPSEHRNFVAMFAGGYAGRIQMSNAGDLSVVAPPTWSTTNSWVGFFIEYHLD